MSVPLVALYAATAATFLLLAHRFVRPLRPAAALLLLCAPGVIAGRALVTGAVMAPVDVAYDAPPLSHARESVGVGPTRSPVLSDVAASYVPWRKAVRHAVENGEWPLWNPFVHAGEPLLAALEPAVFHPATWLGFLLPLAQAWSFEMALRLFLALLCGYLFFREIRAGEVPAIFGASVWAFSDFLVFYLGFPLSGAAAPFPLLLLGLRRLTRPAASSGLAITVAALVLVVTAGHPETLFHVFAAAGLYFLFELVWAPRDRRLPAVVRSLSAGALAIGLCAVVLMPFAEILGQSREWEHRVQWSSQLDKSLPLAQGARLAAQNIVPHAYGVLGSFRVEPGLGTPSAYAGAIIFPFAVAGALARRRRERWPLLLLLALGLAFWSGLPVVTDVIGALPLFELALNQRLVFLAAFALAALAALGAERLRSGYGARSFLAGAGISLALVAGLTQARRPGMLALGAAPREILGRFAIQVVPLLLAMLIVATRPAARSRALAAALAVLLVQRGLEVGRLNPTLPARAFFPSLKLFEALPRGEPYRVAPLDLMLVPNFSTLYELEDVRGYSSLTLRPFSDTFRFWAARDPHWWNRIADPSHPFLKLLNVRYVIAPSESAGPPGWHPLTRERGGTVFENPDVLPRVFVPRELFFENRPWEHFQMTMHNPDYARYAVLMPQGGGAASYAVNGRASARILSYGSQRIRVRIEATEPAWIATSIPRWPGWKVRRGSSNLETTRLNWAFWGFRVPAGRHEVELRYLPDGFVWGLRISVATALLCLAAAARRKLGFPFALRPADVRPSEEAVGSDRAEPARNTPSAS